MRSVQYTLPLLVLALPACRYTEDALQHKDLTGIVRIPKEVAQITLQDNEFNTWEIDDPRAIGPVYIGVFSGIRDDLYPYLHPEQGPVLDEGEEPNTYPYGGTTVGRFDFGCYEQTVCKTVTGRFEDYDDVLDFWENSLQEPMVNTEGEEVGAAEYQEWCYETQYVTSDDELDFIGPVDFEEDGDYYVAEFEILHTLYVEGASVWGWIDMPSSDYDFLTCDPEAGDYFYYYDQQYYTGTNENFVLNRPGDYIDSGDWVVDEPAVITDPEQEFEITMGYQYVE